MLDLAARRTFLEKLEFGLVLVSIGTAMLAASRKTEIKDCKTQSQKYALTIAQSVQQSMVSADLILSSVAQRLKDAHVDTPADVRAMLATAEVFKTLQPRLAIALQVDMARIVALNGDVVNLSRSFPRRRSICLTPTTSKLCCSMTGSTLSSASRCATWAGHLGITAIFPTEPTNLGV